jgi:hypothetical protein
MAKWGQWAGWNAGAGMHLHSDSGSFQRALPASQ